jgi:MFS family permease
VLLVVRESPRRAIRALAPPTLQVLRAARPGTIKALAVLMVAQGLQQTSYGAAQNLVVLRFVKLMPNARDAQSITGLTFALAGVATALAAITFSRLLRRSNYRTVTITAAVLLGLTLLGAAAGTTPAVIIIAFVLSSFVSGSMIPAFGTMVGLEAPPIVQATIFGFSSSAVSIGFGFGPLIGGLIAAAANAQVGLAVAATLALVLALVLWAAAREPRPPQPVTVVSSSRG